MAHPSDAEVEETSNNQEIVQNETEINATENTTSEGTEGTQDEAPAENRLGFFSIAKTLIVRCVIIYAISSFFRRTPPPTTQGGSEVANINAPVMVPTANIFHKDLLMDMYVYVNEQEHFTEFDNKESLIWHEDELMYGDWISGPDQDGNHYKNIELQISQNVITNGSIYIHVYFVKAGFSPNPKDKEDYSKRYTLHRSKMLNRFKKRKFHTLSNLLTGKTEAHPDLVRALLPNETRFEILNHWHPNLTINLVDDHTPWTKNGVPPPLDEYIQFLSSSNHYYPILYFNEYWNLNKDFMPINETTPILNLSLTYQPLSLFKWQMYAAQGMRNKWYSSILGDSVVEESDEDEDSLKLAFLETNPYLLAITIVVSLVHSVFEFLAFKNDIQFWRSRKSLEGLSVRSVMFGVFQSVIVFLYILDNDTNFVVRVSVFVGLLIEIWKITKVQDVKFDYENKILGLIPRLKVDDKETYTESETKKYDRLAFKYLSWGLFPLLGCYAVYSLLYNEHKGLYSYILNMMYGFLLLFGFIMMTPQLFINYKLKSVAHLPWRMLTYKALNTFIDDLFAFVIRMPTLYRLGCFRDDIIFIIYVYQRYIYRIDPSRLNEFGTTGEDDNVIANGDIPKSTESNGCITNTDNASTTEISNTEPKDTNEKKND